MLKTRGLTADRVRVSGVRDTRPRRPEASESSTHLPACLPRPVFPYGTVTERAALAGLVPHAFWAATVKL